jgi:hypothetical protein
VFICSPDAHLNARLNAGFQNNLKSWFHNLPSLLNSATVRNTPSAWHCLSHSESLP